MNLAPDDVKTAISILAFAVSLFSLYVTRINWIQSNRPVISAFVDEHSSGNMAATYNLIIANTGSRPAVNVQLHASQEKLSSLLDVNAESEKLDSISMIFSSQSKISLLRNGEELSTSFGATINNPSEKPWLCYGTEIEISISYQDLEGRKHKSKQPLKIYAREGFGGNVWVDPKV
ncbi:hypothetical protein [Undibacterium sp. YM2]|uniref:hypothetical protein n=1 Tax=Undibacterium sp. YM2 TaxID=2058625 RepID=UPI00138977CB|nr:hypothetical protein [Undibacterium sp. YM2]